MAIRPGRCYTTRTRAWTRTTKRVASKAFVRGAPDSKIHVLDMGDAKKMRSYDLIMDLVMGEDCQIRDNALEAARVAANKVFEKDILPENYYFKVRVYPHQCLREHSMLTGAGADRLSDGMRLSFGKPNGRAAAVSRGQAIFTVYTFKKFADAARYGFETASKKMPGNAAVEIREKNT
jgi:large subunit ribosomal protein L10e